MKEISYVSTRGGTLSATASQAIIKGIADDGGLFVPTEIPKPTGTLEQLVNMSYNELAYEIMKLYLTDFTEDELQYCIEKAYDEKFDTPKIAPVVEKDGKFFLELFHGKTLAFKDMALSILPYLMKSAMKKNNIHKEVVILAATSGDTGKAALSGFANVGGTKIIVFFPEEGVSEIQKRQMVTQKGKNVYVCGVFGNFDDAQSSVKEMFADKKLNNRLAKKGYIFSSANSINIGRLIPQIVYYFYAYGQMVNRKSIQLGENINFSVPTGNFGNILACYYAKQMGLPIGKIICASNENKVLYDFFKTGTYDKNREFILTISPSMDIIVSSNLERFLYHLSNSTEKTKELMEKLNVEGKYHFESKTTDIVPEFSTDDEVRPAIKEMYEKGYIMDTHTAVAYNSYNKYVEKTKDTTKTVIVSTASPFKFTSEVLTAIDSKYEWEDAFMLLETLARLNNSNIPLQIKDIDKKEIKHVKVVEKNKIKDFVNDALEL